MGIQINIGDHTSSVTRYVTVPASRRSVLHWARSQAKAIAKGNPKANKYFKGLSGGRTLTQLTNDSSIWINYYPGLTLFGEAEIGGKELALGPNSFSKGKWVVLGTLIHELAHINGAPTGNDTQAEEALYHCGLGTEEEWLDGIDDPSTPYDPGSGG
ncbi:MAG: hypothetical protein ABI564_04385 [Ideonella sp.]